VAWIQLHSCTLPAAKSDYLPRFLSNRTGVASPCASLIRANRSASITSIVPCLLRQKSTSYRQDAAVKFQHISELDIVGAGTYAEARSAHR